MCPLTRGSTLPSCLADLQQHAHVARSCLSSQNLIKNCLPRLSHPSSLLPVTSGSSQLAAAIMQTSGSYTLLPEHVTEFAPDEYLNVNGPVSYELFDTSTPVPPYQSRSTSKKRRIDRACDACRRRCVCILSQAFFLPMQM